MLQRGAERVQQTPTNISDVLFLLNKNKQIHPGVRLEDTWITSFLKNERQKYKDAMRLLSLLLTSENNKKILFKTAESAEEQNTLLTSCKEMEKKVFHVMEKLEQKYCGRKGNVSASAKPTYIAIGKRMGPFKKKLQDINMTLDDAVNSCEDTIFKC